MIIESKTLQFLGLKEQNEYIVENFYMSTQTRDGITYLKVDLIIENKVIMNVLTYNGTHIWNVLLQEKKKKMF